MNLKGQASTKYKYKERFDYPLTKKLIKIIEQEYRDETMDKGNSWRQQCSMEFLLEKLQEEFAEVEQAAANRMMPNGYIQSELVDLILVAAMLHQRLDNQRTKSRKNTKEVCSNKKQADDQV